MLSLYLSKVAAQQGVNSPNTTLKDLKINKLAKTVDTATITVSNITRVAVRNTAMDGAASAATGTMKPAPGATDTTKFGQLTLGKGTNKDELTKVANERLPKDIIYTYWDDYGQFGNAKTYKTGHYSNSACTGVKEYLSYDSAHVDDYKKNAIMLDGMNEFDTLFGKYEKVSIWHPKATLLAITAFISKLLVIPTTIDIWDIQLTVKVLYQFANTTRERFTTHWNYQKCYLNYMPSH